MGSEIQDSRGDRWEVSRIVASAAIGELRFEIISGSQTTVRNLGKISQAIWNALSGEAVTKHASDIWIRARRSSQAIEKPKSSRLWQFEQKSERVYGKLSRSFLDHPIGAAQKEALIEGLLYLFRNDDAICEFSRNSSLIAMSLTDHFARAQRDFVFNYDSLQHSAIAGLAIDSSDPHTLARGLCAYVMPDPEHEIEISWSMPSWNPISGGIILSGKIN